MSSASAGRTAGDGLERVEKGDGEQDCGGGQSTRRNGHQDTPARESRCTASGVFEADGRRHCFVAALAVVQVLLEALSLGRVQGPVGIGCQRFGIRVASRLAFRAAARRVCGHLRHRTLTELPVRRGFRSVRRRCRLFTSLSLPANQPLPQRLAAERLFHRRTRFRISLAETR